VTATSTTLFFEIMCKPGTSYAVEMLALREGIAVWRVGVRRVCWQVGLA
jgi:hypothetical protein